MRKTREAGNPMFSSNGFQHELDTSRVDPQKFRQMIRDSFHQWVGQFNLRDLDAESAVFVCDADGCVLSRFAWPTAGSDGELPLSHLREKSCWNREHIGPNAVDACMLSMEPERMDGESHSEPVLQKFDSYAFPVMCGMNQTAAVLGLICAKRCKHDPFFWLKSAAPGFRTCLQLNLERSIGRGYEDVYQNCERKVRQCDALFQVVKKFHAANDAVAVLQEVTTTLQELYPSSEIELFVSQDFQSSHLPVKVRTFHKNGRDLFSRAFLEGSLLSETDEGRKASTVAAPLCGKQGVYGVLSICSENGIFDETDMEWISMIAESAGTAFEKAKLFEQSNLLIGELRLINEMTRRLNQSLRLSDIFDYASEEVIRIFSADYGCILKYEEEEEELVVQAGNLPDMIQESFSLEYGFAGLVFHSREPVIVSDYLIHPKVESRFMEATRSRSLIAAPIVVNSNVIGVILVSHRHPDYFSYDNYRLLQVLSGHIGLALTNAKLHAEVERMVITDNLTGLYARHYLDDQLKIRQKHDSCGSLVIVDIDHFKKVNDRYGHQIGDKVLTQVSGIIKTSIRDSDIAARWGGEEFAIYLPKVNMDHAVMVAERIRSRISRESEPDVTVSCGISQWDREDDTISVEHLFYRADMALYAAKNGGRNQVRVADGREGEGTHA